MQLKHAENLQKAKFEAGYKLATFCGEISKENKRDYINLKIEKK